MRQAATQIQFKTYLAHIGVCALACATAGCVQSGAPHWQPSPAADARSGERRLAQTPDASEALPKADELPFELVELDDRVDAGTYGGQPDVPPLHELTAHDGGQTAPIQPPQQGESSSGKTDNAAKGAPGGCNPAAAGVGLPLAKAPAFSAVVSAPHPVFATLSAGGASHFPDGAVSFLPGGGGWEVFLPVGNMTARLAGNSPLSAQWQPKGAVIGPTGNGADPHHGYAGATSVFACKGDRVAIFHAEFHGVPVAPVPGSPPPYHASMCRAVAKGNSANFVVGKPARILTSGGVAKHKPKKIAYGAGGGSVFDPGGDFLYMYYFDWDQAPGVHVARACKATCGAPGSWRKWNGAGFASGAMGASFLTPSGPSKAIVAATPGKFDAFTVVSFNTYLGAYLMVAATESGIALRVSSDGINWGGQVALLKHTKATDNTMRALYPTLVDANTWSRDKTGRDLKLIYGLEANTSGAKAAHIAWIADVHLSVAGAAKAVSWDRLQLKRWYNKPAGDHRCTTAPVAGYAAEGGLGLLAANAIPGTAPLYDCVQGGNHLASRASSCEGGKSKGIMGYMWGAPGPGRHAIYRCWLPGPGGKPNHFLSVDSGCEGQKSDGVIGYVQGGGIAAPKPKPPNKPPAGPEVLVKLTRFMRPSPLDHWCTTKGAPSGYKTEGGLGKLRASAGPNTLPLYDCAHGGNHLVSVHSHCEGGTKLAVLGHGWKTPGPNRHALYRCWMTAANGKANHFLSLSGSCEGQKSEGVVAYAK